MLASLVRLDGQVNLSPFVFRERKLFEISPYQTLGIDIGSADTCKSGSPTGNHAAGALIARDYHHFLRDVRRPHVEGPREYNGLAGLLHTRRFQHIHAIDAVGKHHLIAVTIQPSNTYSS